jgi:hypothetical protein
MFWNAITVLSDQAGLLGKSESMSLTNRAS